MRAQHGKKRPPLSVKRRRKILGGRTLKGAGLGTLAGYVMDPTGGVLTVTGALLGGIFGRSEGPRRMSTITAVKKIGSDSRRGARPGNSPLGAGNVNPEFSNFCLREGVPHDE